jgi:hypothetical protein
VFGSNPAVQDLIRAERLIESAEEDLEEGETPRSYLSSVDGGFQFSYLDGRIQTLFVFLLATDGVQSFSRRLIAGLTPSSTREDVRHVLGKPSYSGQQIIHSILGPKGPWDRYDREFICLHFEYAQAEDGIRQITVMTVDAAPTQLR